MSKPRDSVIWGAILVLVGVGFLVWNLGIVAAIQVTVAWTLMAFSPCWAWPLCSAI